jgi:hypothetical protein
MNLLNCSGKKQKGLGVLMGNGGKSKIFFGGWIAFWQGSRKSKFK